MVEEKKEEELTENPEDENIAIHGFLDDEIKPPSSEIKVQPKKEEPKKEESIDALIKKAVKSAEDKLYAQLNKRLTALGQENKKLRDRVQQPSNEDVLLESILQDKRKQAVSGDVDPMISVLESQLVERKRQAQIRKQEQIAGDAWDKISEQLTNAGLSPDDDSVESVIDAFEDARDNTGNFDRVQRKLNKVIANRKAPEQIKELPKETEEERVERLVEERLRRRMEESGQLISDDGLPSAASGSFQDFEKKYIKGEVSQEKYEERARKEGKLL